MENTIDYRLGQISSDIGSLKKLHEEDKVTRDDNHRKISEISDAVLELKQIYLRLDSWKNGQTVYMHKTTEDIQKLEMKVENHKDGFDRRLIPVEAYIAERTASGRDNAARIRENSYSLIKWLVVGFVGATLVNAKAIYYSFMQIITK